VPVSQGWEDRAEQWIAWARKPSHDAYLHYRDAFFDILPEPDARALEIGCGEGRVCRDLRARGYAIVGLDASPTLVSAARAADPEGEYVVGAAESLPFAEGSFALVTAHNSLMDVEDMSRAVAEAARVVRPGGRFCACVTHPYRERGTWEPGPAGDDERFVIDTPYFGASAYRRHMARDGLEFTFESRTYPLSDYTAALERSGLLIEALREPEGVDERDRVMPEFVIWRALKPEP
jgi:SAM-dependent methyltransferase